MDDFNFKLPTKELDEIFDHLQIDKNDNNRMHFAYLMKALKIHNERARGYGSSWKDLGGLSNLLQMIGKTNRLKKLWWTSGGTVPEGFLGDPLDDAIDIINYSIFFVRCVEEGNLYGQ